MERIGRSAAFFFEAAGTDVSDRFRTVVQGEVFECDQHEHPGVLAGGLEAFFGRDRCARTWAPFFDIADDPLQILQRLRDNVDRTADPGHQLPHASAANVALRRYWFDAIAGFGISGFDQGSIIAISDGIEEVFMWTKDWVHASAATVKVRAVDAAADDCLQFLRRLNTSNA